MEAARLAKRHKFFGHLKKPLLAVARRVHLVSLEPPARIPRIFSRQQTSRPRAIGNYANAVGLGHRQQLHLGLAFDQVVHRLHHLQARPVVALLNIDGALRLPRRVVAHGRVEHLARPHQVFERPHRLLDRCAFVELVQEQHLNPIRLETPQARLKRAHHMAARSAARIDVVTDRVKALGRDDQIIAMPLHQPAQNFFRAAIVVLVGTVEEIDAGITAGLVHRL